MAVLQALSPIMVASVGYVDRNDIFEIDDTLIDERIRRCCVNADGSAITIRVKTLEDMTLAELRQKASALGINHTQRTTRAQLIERINEADEMPTGLV
jgi:hypothetical protein